MGCLHWCQGCSQDWLFSIFHQHAQNSVHTWNILKPTDPTASQILVDQLHVWLDSFKILHVKLWIIEKQTQMQDYLESYSRQMILTIWINPKKRTNETREVNKNQQKTGRLNAEAVTGELRLIMILINSPVEKNWSSSHFFTFCLQEDFPIIFETKVVENSFCGCIFSVQVTFNRLFSVQDKQMSLKVELGISVIRCEGGAVMLFLSLCAMKES